MHTDPKRLLLKIVLRFFLLYFGLLLIYSIFLNRQKPDIFTLTTAKQVNMLYRAAGIPSYYFVMDNPAEIGIKADGQWLVKIIEGCNGMSVIFVFLAFVWAFPARWRYKLVYSIAGIFLIWTVNLLRIFILGFIYRDYPEWFDFSHRVLFPASIYGMVVILWIIWIRKILREGKV